MIVSPIRFLFLVPLVSVCACGSMQKNDGNTDSARAACAPLSLTEAQLVEEAELLSWLSGPVNFLPEHQGPGLAFGDLNEDGFLDALLAVRSGGLLVLLNDGSGLFQEGFPLQVEGPDHFNAVSLALSDIDADGDLDAAITSSEGFPDHILYNPGNTGAWSAVELESSSSGSLTPSFGDWDGDGDLDLFVPGFADTFSAGDSEGQPHRIYMQQPSGTFILDMERLPDSSRFGSAYQAQPLDIDLDGDLDLFLVHDLPFLSQLLLNDGSGHFVDASDDCLCTQVRAAMGVGLGDTNGDGLPDFFVTGWQDNRFFVSAGDGSYFDQAAAIGLVPESEKSEVGWGALFTDLDLDGDEDLIASFGGPTRDPQDHPKIADNQEDAIWIRKSNGEFQDKSRALSWQQTHRGRGVYVVDMNRDHSPDIVVLNNAGFEIWHGDGGCAPGLTVSLQGPAGDPHGEAARLTLHESGGDRHVWMQRSTTFGNGPSEKVLPSPDYTDFSELTVQWSDGHQQRVSVPEGESFLMIQRE